MEKSRPTYDLESIKRAIGSVETLSISRTALNSALMLGFDDVGIVGVVGSANRKMFVKSMTTYGDHRVWQDVYHVPADGLIVYLKFQADLITEFKVVSFKEK